MNLGSLFMTQEEKRGDMKSRNEILEKKFICARSFIAPRTSLPFGHAHFCRRGRAECQEEFTTGRWAPLEGKRYQRYHRRGFLSLTSARRRRSDDDGRNLAAAWELYCSARDRSEVTDVHMSYSAAQETKWSLSTSPIYLEDGIEAVVIKQASVWLLSRLRCKSCSGGVMNKHIWNKHFMSN